MAFSYCFCHHQLSLKIGLVRTCESSVNDRTNPRSSLALERACRKPARRQGGGAGSNLINGSGFLRGSRFIIQPEPRRAILYKKNSRLHASWLPASQIASNVFTLGTVAVLPFYTLMVVAPRSELTKRSMESSTPYILLGLLYAYLLYLSWTPETLRYMFANKYWMPELPGIAKMFSNEMTLASAWIHLLAVDLFAARSFFFPALLVVPPSRVILTDSAICHARQVYQDGLQNNIETRHSVSLCLLFCPVGVLSHFLTKTLIRNAKRNKNQKHQEME